MPALRTMTSEVETSEKVSMQQNAFLRLKEMIHQGRIRPGEKLLEVQVAKAFGISRSPARHALRALCDAKLVRESPGRGYEVAGRSKAADVGQVAMLEELRIAPLPQWERVYKSVEQELCIRVLFGSVRITEAPMAEYFGVSRTVARDVLGRMHSVGLVSKDGLGHWIGERVLPERIRHLFELRALLEPEALRQAAGVVSRDELERMKARLEQTIRHVPFELGAIGQAETDLHISLLSSCPNREITKALVRTHLLFVPSLYLVDHSLGIPQDIMAEALHEHLGVVDQLLQRNVDTAMVRLREHLQGADERWFKRFAIAAQNVRLDFPPYLAAFHAERAVTTAP